MINCERGRVKIVGDPVRVMSEFTCIVQAFREYLAEEGGEEFADKTIVHCGRLAYMSDEEKRRKVIEILNGGKNV